MRVTRIAVAVIFIVNGFVYGSWVGRLPALADQVGAGTGLLGLALVGVTIGLTTGAQLSGRFCARWGARRVTLLSAALVCCLLPLLSLTRNAAELAASLFLIGFVVGHLDVSQNVLAVHVVEMLRRPVMPSFHAAFSIGGLLGSGSAAVAAGLDRGPGPHFVLVSLLGLGAIAAVARPLPDSPKAADPQAPDASALKRSPARDRALWLLAAIAFCSAVGEGAAANWTAIFLVTEHRLAESTAAIGYSAFSIAMAVARLAGDRIERRAGAHTLLAASGLLAGSGYLIAAAAPRAGLSFAGFVLAGLGLALVFPIALGQAGALGRAAHGSGGEREIAFVSGIAYVGFVVGPPAVGALAERTSLAVALAVVAAAVMQMAPTARLFHRLTRQRSAHAETPTDNAAR